MSVLDDDTLRAMLADRADRLSPNTAGLVRALCSPCCRC